MEDPSGFAFGQALLMLSLDVVLYFLLAIYLQKVFPSKCHLEDKMYRLTCLLVRISACLYACTASASSLYLSISLPVYMSVRLPLCQSVCLSVCLSACLPVCLSVLLPASFP